MKDVVGTLSRGSQVRVLPGAPSVACREVSLFDLFINGGRSSVGRALDCDSSRRGFESHRPPHFGPLAQLVEQVTLNHSVRGSNP